MVDRTWFVEDGCGSPIDPFLQHLIITDFDTPIPIAPSDAFITCDESIAPTNTGFATNTVIDSCSEPIVFTFTDEIIDPGCPGLIQRIWSATDLSGNTGMATQMIHIEGNTGLVLIPPPDYTTTCLSEGISTNLSGTATATTDCGTIVDLSFTDTALFELRDRIRRTWRVEDSCGRIDTAYQDLFSSDTTRPRFTHIPSDTAIPHCAYTDNSQDPHLGQATAADSCPVEVTFKDTLGVSTYFQEDAQIRRVWTATDTAGNTAEATQFIAVQSANSKDVLWAPPAFTVQCNSDSPFVHPDISGYAIAKGFCNGPTVDYMPTFSDTLLEDTPHQKTILRTWSATLNPLRTWTDHQIIVIYPGDLEIIAPPDFVLSGCYSNNVPPGISGTAAIAGGCGNATLSYRDTQTPFPGGMQIERTWFANEGFPEEVSDIQVILLTLLPDVDSPNMIVPSDELIFDNTQEEEIFGGGGGGGGGYSGSSSSPTGTTVSFTPTSESPLISDRVATAQDDCSTEVWTTFTDHVTGEQRRFNMNREWITADASSNIRTNIQRIALTTLEDAVVIPPPTAHLVSTNDLSPAITGEPFVQENCTNAPLISYSDTLAACPGVIERTWTVNGCFGSTNFVQEIRHVRNSGPKPIITAPPSLRVDCGSSTDTNVTGFATAVDGGGNPATVTFQDHINRPWLSCPQLIRRVWVATDTCGQTSGADQLILVSDTGDLQVFAPPRAAIICGEDSSPAITGHAFAFSSNCTNPAVISYFDDAHGRRTWLATNPCGEAAEVRQSIQRRTDRLPAAIHVPPNVVVPCNDDISTNVTGVATTADSCFQFGSFTYTDHLLLGTNCPTRIYREWQTTDSFGNEGIDTQIIHLGNDVFPPELPDDPGLYTEPGIFFNGLSVIRSARARQTGDWSFWTLMERIAAPAAPKEFILDWLQQWESDQMVNGYPVPARSLIREYVINPWKAVDHPEQPNISDADWQMQAANAPFRLLAIVNRIDLTDESNGVVHHAGEANFTFGVRGIEQPNGPAIDLPFNIIFEFQQPATDAATRTRWARSWSHAATLEHGHRKNAALALLTEEIAQQANFLRIRSNENALAPSWEFRQFERGNDDRLHITPLPNTPDLSTFNLGGPENAALANYLNANATDILAEIHEAPLTLPGNLPFLGGRSESISAFQAIGVAQDVRHKFSLNTCMGCHFSETDTNFRHIRAQTHRPSLLSPMLLNDTIEVPDPVNAGETIIIDILARRKAIIEALVNPPANAAAQTTFEQLIKMNKMLSH